MVEGDGRLGKRETVERQGISASQCGSTVLGQHGKGCLDILGLDWTVMGRIRKEKWCTRTGDLTSGLWTRLGNTVPVEGARTRACLFFENSVQRSRNLALGGDSVSGHLSREQREPLVVFDKSGKGGCSGLRSVSSTGKAPRLGWR